MSKQRFESVFNVKPSFILNWLAQKGYGGKTLTEGFMAYLSTKNGNGTTITESLNACLTNLGYTGTLDDKLRSFYVSSTGISHPKDAEMAFYQGSGDFSAGQGGIDSYTKLMLHMDGTNGSTTFTDSSLSPKTVTASGNAQISTAQSKFGGASGLFDGSGDFVYCADSADWSMGTGDFTYDGWFYASSLASTLSPFSQYADGQNRMFAQVSTLGAVNFYSMIGNVAKAYYYTANGVISTGSWNHIMWVRNGSNFYIFVNGISQSLTTSVAIGTNDLGDIATTFNVGGQASLGNYWNGHIDEFRVSKGIARRTSDFTPPTSAYTT